MCSLQPSETRVNEWEKSRNLVACTILILTARNTPTKPVLSSKWTSEMQQKSEGSSKGCRWIKTFEPIS